MKNFLLALLLLPSLLAAQSPAQCTDHTVSATGRTLALTNARVDLMSAQVSYYTTGSPTGVSATVEAGNKLTTVQTPFTKIGAVTNTTGADMGGAAGAYRYWWVNLGTLTGGTSPTVIFTTCFSPIPWEHFTTAGAVPVDLTFVGGTAVPATAIGTVATAAENTAQWIKTLSALSGLDGAAGAGSQQVPLVVVSTAVPNLKTDLSTLAGTAPVNAGVAGTLAVGGNVAAGAAPTTNPVPMGTFDGTNTERLRSDTTGRLIPSIAENTFAAQNGDGSTAVYNASIYGPLQHTAQLDIVVTDKTVATCTYNLEGSLTGVAGTFLTVSGGQDCSAAATKTVIFSVADRLVKYVRGTITLWTEGAGATPPTLTLTYAGAR